MFIKKINQGESSQAKVKIKNVKPLDNGLSKKINR